MNKVLYAREGAKCIMDNTFADLPWQVRVEVDGVEIEVPEVIFCSFIIMFMNLFICLSRHILIPQSIFCLIVLHTNEICNSYILLVSNRHKYAGYNVYFHGGSITISELRQLELGETSSKS